MNNEITNVSTKLVVGMADPTFSPISPPYTGTSVASWGVFGLPTGAIVGVGSTDTEAFEPRAIVQIGPVCLPPADLLMGFVPLPEEIEFSLEVNGDTLMTGDLIVEPYPPTGALGDITLTGTLAAERNVTAGGYVTAGGNVTSNGGAHVLAAKKNFDIPHPTKEGWRLTHSCVEGPEAAVYVRGRVTNETEIILPEYWKELIDVDTVTVNLTPIGVYQEVFIQKWDCDKVYLSVNSGMPINCFYHIMAERKDTEKLIPEYKGSIEDYPGDNSQRSIAGYNYDRRA
jgi:hypothetical protein